MPVVSTKLNANDYKNLKAQAEAQGDTISAYVRKQLRPKIVNNSILTNQAINQNDREQELKEENKILNVQSTPEAKPIKVRLRV